MNELIKKSDIYNQSSIPRFREGNRHTDERHQLSDKNPTQRDECTGTNETTKMYEELRRTVHDDDRGNYVNAPQRRNLYAALDFARNDAAT